MNPIHRALGDKGRRTNESNDCMTSLAKGFAVLDLFCEVHPVWHADEINHALGYTRATGYRYVKDLVEAGFLRKVSAGRYSLGPRIIELDYQLRRSDPVLLAASPVMDELVKKTGLDAVLSTLFDDRVVDIHRASGDPTLRLSYGRGRPMPLLLGAAAKIMISHLGRRQMLRIYEAHAQEVQSLGLGASWSDFRIRMHAIHAEGFYLSLGEVESNVGAAAVPLFDMDGEPAAALALVGLTEAISAIGEKQLRKLLRKAQDDVRRAIGTRSTLPLTA